MGSNTFVMTTCWRGAFRSRTPFTQDIHWLANSSSELLQDKVFGKDCSRSALHWATSIFTKVGFRIARHCVRGGSCKPRKESGSKTREWSEIPSRGTTVAEVGKRPELTRVRSRQVLLGIRVGCDPTSVIQNSEHISSRYRRWDVGCCLSTSMLRSPRIINLRLWLSTLSMLHAIWEPAQSADCMGLSMQSADCMVRSLQTAWSHSFSKFQRNLRFSARINFLTKQPNLKENNLCLFDNGYYSFSCL